MPESVVRFISLSRSSNESADSGSPSILQIMSADSRARTKGDATTFVIPLFFKDSAEADASDFPFSVSEYGSVDDELMTAFTLCSASPWRITRYALPLFFTRSFKSSTEPMTTCSDPSLFSQMGSGVPQYRSREIAQSLAPESHSPNLPS